MAHIGEIVNKEKLDNYISVLLGLRFMLNRMNQKIIFVQNVFVRFLKIPEINCTKSRKKNALLCIETLLLSHGLPERFLQKPKRRLALFDVLNELHNDEMDQAIIVSDGTLEKRLQEITGILNKKRRYYLYIGPSPKTMKLISIVSRKWLIGKILAKELASLKKCNILAAEMGYGKSSIVSNIVCAEQPSDWYAIRKHVLEYHFCRYDSIRSKKAVYSIRNIIASAIFNRYPKLGNSILYDDIAHEILYGLRNQRMKKTLMLHNHYIMSSTLHTRNLRRNSSLHRLLDLYHHHGHNHRHHQYGSEEELLDHKKVLYTV
ncbi:unnamed protein product [Mytilus coruscus]|uniref:Uncharacterized protein n=1 Tax=Mytilus coruscus TaxID=42192 RepID=A0A6J8BMN5_MYTCO|nr:unnamed protein product [Mytilus coruscus]